MKEMVHLSAQRLEQMHRGAEIETDQIDNCVSSEVRNALSERSILLGPVTIDYDTLDVIPFREPLIRFPRAARDSHGLMPAADETRYQPRADMTCCANDDDFHWRYRSIFVPAMTDDLQPRDPRTYMSAERTFLSWIRTGVALMAFGFVVARFGVFLREIQQTTHQPTGAKTSVSIYIGLGLVAAGVITSIASALKHQRYIRALDENNFRESFGSTFAFALVMLLALVGIAMAVVLLTL